VSRKTAYLRALVHAEAIAMAPRQYMQAFYWRVTGKKLRAKLKLAPLLGQTRHAYDLWQAMRAREPLQGNPKASVRIIALVEDGEGASATLASLAKAQIEGRVIAGEIDSELRKLVGEPGNLWVMPLSSGDRVHPEAGQVYRKAANAAPQSIRLIYSDDDLITETGKRHTPHFKPDWNSELFKHHDYLTGAAIVRVDSVVGTGTDWIEAVVADAICRTLKMDGEALHCREVLHHRRTRAQPRVPIVPAEPPGPLPGVSVVVPTRDRVDLLRTCLEGLSRTDYPHRPEIIVIDNGSTDPATIDYLAGLDPQFARVLHDERAFNFAALTNRAAAEAKGELLCFLNNDIEIIAPEWLKTMAKQAIRADAGAVGAQLLYPDGRIQHAGIATGIGGAAAHAHKLLHPDDAGYFKRHNLPQFVSAVTAACMVVERAKFESIEGFDEESFAVSFNDVDLCLRLSEKGWRNLYEPRAQLIHHESVSRGFDRDPVGSARQDREVAALQERWGTKLATDEEMRERRAHDPYHHPDLSPYSEQFVLRL